MPAGVERDTAGVPAELHPDIAPLVPLLGTWSGSGEGEYPTIEPFSYLETVTFAHVGKPQLSYAQRTRSAADGRPLHAETGYFRVAGPARAELVVAHPTGLVEVQEGAMSADEGLVIDLTSTVVAGTSTAKDVVEVTRRLEVVGDVLRYTVAMAAVGRPLTHHLAAVLRREA